MKRLTFSALALLCVGLCGSAAHADLNSGQRLRAFAKLPDWSGLWEQFNLGPSGAPDDPAEMHRIIEVSADHPPYNAEWQAKIEVSRR